jgi:hypothetical protein
VAALERHQVDAVAWREIGYREPVCARSRQLLTEEGATVFRAIHGAQAHHSEWRKPVVPSLREAQRRSNLRPRSRLSLNTHTPSFLSGEAALDIALDEGLRLEVLHPGAELLAAEGYNDNSIVTRLTYGQASLLTGDITAEVEEQLVANGSPLTSTVLKAPHHGSCTSTTAPFLDAVDPELVVISVGEDNDFDHPCDDVLERLEVALSLSRAEPRDPVEGRLPLYRTDEHGTVEIVSDGSRLWVETERGR